MDVVTLGRREFVRRAAAGLGAVALADGLGPATAWASGDDLVLANSAIAGTWSVAGGALRWGKLEDRLGEHAFAAPADVFTVTLADGSSLRATDLRVVGAPKIETVRPVPGASRAADRAGGRRITVSLRDPVGRVRATWRAILPDGASYLRQEVTVEAAEQELGVRGITLLDFDLPGAEESGTVTGSPIIAGNLFLGVEHPLAVNVVSGERVRCVLPRKLPLRPGVPLACSSVVGTTAPDQMRRGFLEYLERERAHPYRPFLHYNSWYDLGYFTQYKETDAAGVIAAIGNELHKKRGVTLDSYLFDDGWDDPSTLWHFNAGFPHGFAPLKAAAAAYGAAPGVWMSPWGGYGKPRDERLAAAKTQGFETNGQGLALSGPKYYQRFRETCLEFMRAGGVNQFKFDGTSGDDTNVPGSAFGSDFEAMIHLIGELRAVKPDLYVNLTSGTFPSPFWLRYCDSIWRGGDDHSFTGDGSDRQKWINYRDAATYGGVVRQGPLFPLSSLMLHGMIYAAHADKLDQDPGKDFQSEVRAFFGTGTQLQEMYVTPQLLSPQNWDDLAEAAKWARSRADVLRDTHWVGGDPGKHQVYGHAGWSKGSAFLCLRNPKNQPQTISLDPADALELPAGAAKTFRASSPWASDRGKGMALRLVAGQAHEFALQPFEVLTLDLTATA